MTREKTKETKLASVLSFEKKLVPSDGLLYGTRWEERAEKSKATLLSLREKSVRGTISNRLKATTPDNTMKLNANIEDANLQTIDAASLGAAQDTLKLCFTLKILPNAAVPAVCNLESHRQRIQQFGAEYKAAYGFSELAKRYAMNIANGRFFWRNRVGAEKLEVKVTCRQVAKAWTFDAYHFNLNNFNTGAQEVRELAALIEETLSWQQEQSREQPKMLFLEIEAFALIGNGQEIYPSEELVLDKGKKKKSKILYEVEGTAALHSQKIGNALRTIDTWYPTEEGDIGPIAIEPYGAVTPRGTAYRAGSASFYTIFDNYSINDQKPLPEADQAHYVMAVLIRGGVFGQSGKD